jgi:hypothetical protein
MAGRSAFGAAERWIFSGNWLMSNGNLRSLKRDPKTPYSAAGAPAAWRAAPARAMWMSGADAGFAEV